MQTYKIDIEGNGVSKQCLSLTTEGNCNILWSWGHADGTSPLYNSRITIPNICENTARYHVEMTL